MHGQYTIRLEVFDCGLFLLFLLTCNITEGEFTVIFLLVM